MPKAHKQKNWLLVLVAIVYTDVICIPCLLWLSVKKLSKGSLYFLLCSMAQAYSNSSANLKYCRKLDLEQYIHRINVVYYSPNEMKDKCLEEGDILLLGNVIKSLITLAKHLSTLQTIWGCITAKTSQETILPWYKGRTSALQSLFTAAQHSELILFRGRL